MRAKAGVGALGLVLLALLVFTALSAWGRRPAAAVAAPQPINFPHNVHVQTYKIDCQYCHSDARRSEYAGLPSVSRCMGCHRITAADRPEIKKLAEYWAKQEPIPWTRVFKVPEFTYFPAQAARAGGRGVPDVPRSGPGDDHGGGQHRTAPEQRPAQPRRAAAAAARR